MEPQNSNAEHLPDENYIERLFPKCPPKQPFSIGGRGKRLLTLTGSREAQRKQARSRLHQHSRRESEARRSKIKKASTFKDKADSSDSSDNAGNKLNKKGNSSGPSTSVAKQKSTLTPDATASSMLPAPRRAGKYAASQSWLMQLQRSQSNYANSNIASNYQNDSNKNLTQQNTPAVGRDQVVNSTSGIIKSSSCFADINEPKSLSSYNHIQQQQLQKNTYSQQTAGASYETNKFRLNDVNINGSKNDNRQSDLMLGDEFNYSGNNHNFETRLSNLKKSQPKGETPNRVGSLSWNNNLVDYNDAPDTGTCPVDIDENMVDSINGSDIRDADRKGNSAKFIQARSAGGASDLNNILSAPAANVSRTADLVSRDNNNNKAESQAPSNLITTQLVSQPAPQTSLNRSDKTVLSTANPISKKHGASVDEVLERKDDDKYINLFVYKSDDDNTAQHLQISESLPPEKQSQSPRGASRNNRYRKRLDRLASKRKNSAQKTREESSDLLSNANIETTEIIDEERIIDSILSNKSPELQASLNSDPQIEAKRIGSDQTIAQYRQESDSSPKIVAIHHQASQQLLTTADPNDQDDGLIRNDASTEELCSNSSELVEESDKSTISVETKHNIDKRLGPGKNLGHLKASSVATTLQTVDEKAENIIPEQLAIDNGGSGRIDPVSEMSDTETMPFEQTLNHKTKKGFLPPGYPQLVRPQKTTASDYRTGPSNQAECIGEANPSSSVIGKSDKTGSSEASSIHSKNAKVDNLRVKFDEENLMRVRDKLSLDQCGSNHDVELSSTDISGEKCYVANVRRNEHPPQMPSISEVQLELDPDSARNEVGTTGSGLIGRELSASLRKVSLNNCINQEQTTSNEFECQNEPQSDQTQQQPQTTYQKHSNIHATEHREVESQQSMRSEPNDRYQNSDSVKVSRVSADSELNLRHHKLLNETSHYAIVRSVTSNVSEPATVPRSSSIQFNTFSDGESGPEEVSNSSSNNRNYNIMKRSDSATVGFVGRSDILPASTSKNLNEDEMLPTFKTALIFPRLDEGLSSDAESCEDEIEEEDEKAMDADVDADDDDDDDDDLDDDIIGNDNSPVERGTHSVQVSQSTASDCFSRSQQTTKPPIRLMGSVHQQQQQTQPLIDMTPDQQVGIHQAKAPGTAFGSYMSQDLLDHGDLKSLTSYPNQNGQSNYWMGISNQQPHISTAQPSSSQHFNQRPHHNNNSFSRDEAKVTSRLSSDTDNEMDRLLGSQRNDQLKLTNNDVNSNNSSDHQPISNVMKQTANSREVLIEGVLFNVRYLGSTHSDCEGRSEKEDRIHQAEMAVHEVKFRNGESQSATEVQLFISTEKIMVLDDKHRKIMMDHSLRTISYIADIGDAIVLIVRKKNSNSEAGNDLNRPVSKISCHVFESSESHTITKSISQAFQVAYTELLKANGTGDTSSYLPKELDYQEVLNSQEMSTDELEMFARKENQREVIVPKEKGEILGLSLVESGWGSVLPTVVIANLKPDGPAYRCKKLSIGDQILSVNGISLVGLPLAECQEILRKTKSQRVARLSVVPCPITVEVKIKRPDTKYQLGFSVQNGVICSLLRGGIAERGGVRVGHRIMSINGTTVVGVPHEKIVTLLASSVGEIRMKTCLTSLYRLILGEENPVHF